MSREVEEIWSNAQSAHESWRWPWVKGDSNLSHSVRASIKEDSQRTTTQTDNKKRETTKTKDQQCMMAHALASTTLTCSPSVSGHFTHCWVSLCNSCRQWLSVFFTSWRIRKFSACFATACGNPDTLKSMSISSRCVNKPIDCPLFTCLTVLLWSASTFSSASLSLS